MAKSRTILCVDDEPTVLQVTLNILRDAFPNEIFIGLEDSRAAEAIISGQEIAVVLTDLSMPNVDGAEILKLACDNNPRTVTILVTGRASTEGLIRAVNDGYLWRCLEKPWAGAEMEALVKEALEVYEERLSTSDGEAKPSPAPAGEAKPSPAPAGEAKPGPAPASDADAAAQGKKKISISKGSFVRGAKARAGARGAAGGARAAGAAGARAPKIRINNKRGARKLRVMDKRYRDMELMKEGGSGAIYKSFDTLLDIPVAIKIISEEVSSNAAAMRELVSEARIAMSLSHKHIVRLHNIEQGNNFYYLVMEYIEGGTLRDLLKRVKVMPPDMAVQIVDVLEDALGYAHRRGVFHRDIKPDNIMLTGDGVLKMIDFGLACLGETFRRGGEIAGTPYYMSPEEMACEVPDAATDVFSVGVMMHEFVQGALPPHGADTDLDNPLNYLPVANPQLPAEMQAVLQRSFNRDRSERYASMQEFAEAFRNAVAQSYDVSPSE